MNREIKFRGWNGKALLAPQGLTQSAEYWTWLGKQDVLLEQYTGLVDKNGKDVYENDLLRVFIPTYIHEYIEAVVEFRHGCFGVTVIGNPILNNAVGQFKAFSEHTKDIEVIGNVHENPELLENVAPQTN